MSAGIAGRKAMVKVPGVSTAFAAEAFTDSGDHKTYQITNAAKRVWDPTAAITVKIGGVVALPTGADPFTIQRLTGTVLFTNVNAGRAAVTADGSYLPMSNVVRGKGYTFELTATNADDTSWDDVIANGGWIVRLRMLYDIAGTIVAKWSTTDLFFVNALLNGSLVVLEFFPDRTAAHSLICWALLQKTDLSVALESTNDRTVSFQGVQDADGHVAAQ